MEFAAFILFHFTQVNVEQNINIYKWTVDMEENIKREVGTAPTPHENLHTWALNVLMMILYDAT